MTDAEARANLAGFLKEGRANVELLVLRAREQAVDADFSFGTLVDVMNLVFDATKFTIRPPNDVELRLPALYTATAKAIEHESLHGVLTLAYYVGECFARAAPTLRWDVGTRGFFFENQPVVSGFAKRMELAVAPMTRNVLVSAAETDTPVQVFGDWLEHWRGLIEPVSDT